MSNRKKIHPGSVIEIPLPDGRFAYAWYTKDEVMAVYDILSKKRLNIDEIKEKQTKLYMTCNEFLIKRGIWPVIGKIEPEGDGNAPDLARYAEWIPEDSIRRSAVSRHGDTVYVERDYYISLVKKGFISAIFNKAENFPQWLLEHLEAWPDYEMPKD